MMTPVSNCSCIDRHLRLETGAAQRQNYVTFLRFRAAARTRGRRPPTPSCGEDSACRPVESSRFETTLRSSRRCRRESSSRSIRTTVPSTNVAVLEALDVGVLLASSSSMVRARAAGQPASSGPLPAPRRRARLLNLRLRSPLQVRGPAGAGGSLVSDHLHVVLGRRSSGSIVAVAVVARGLVGLDRLLVAGGRAGSSGRSLLWQMVAAGSSGLSGSSARSSRWCRRAGSSAESRRRLARAPDQRQRLLAVVVRRGSRLCSSVNDLLSYVDSRPQESKTGSSRAQPSVEQQSGGLVRSVHPSTGYGSALYLSPRDRSDLAHGIKRGNNQVSRTPD